MWSTNILYDNWAWGRCFVNPTKNVVYFSSGVSLQLRIKYMLKVMGSVLFAALLVAGNSYAESSSASLKVVWTTPKKISIIRTSQLVDQDLATLKTNFDAALAKDKNIIAATNGSFFGYNNLVRGNSTKNIGPTCLYIEKGKQIFPYENPAFCKSRYIFYSTNDNQVGVLPDSEFRTKFEGYGNIKYAIEGVALVYDGKALKIPENDIEYSYQKRHPSGKRRNGICIKEDNSVGLFVNTTSITLEDLTKKLIDKGCKYAVNIDGGGTSSMYIKKGNQYFKSWNDDTIKNNICKVLTSKEAFGKNDWEGCIMDAILVSQ